MEDSLISSNALPRQRIWSSKRALAEITLGNEYPFMLLENRPNEVVVYSSRLDDIVV